MKERFKGIFNEWYPRLVIYVQLKGLNEQDAQDIAEEAFIRLWTRGQEAMDWDKPQKWLCTTARNLVIDHYRHKNTLAKLNEDVIYRTDEIDQIESYALADIWNRLPELPPICRKVIELSLIGKKTGEIMARLGISQQNVLNQKARGIKLLKGKLKPSI
jgi:RNA polymerase sigma-70 factor (ECF subfamily)